MQRPAHGGSSPDRDRGSAAGPGSPLGAVEILNPGSLPSYLRSRGAVPDGAEIVVTPLSGGISNVVLRAEWSGGAIVVKQSLPRLRVEADWEFDRARIFVERSCMDVLADRLPGAAPTVVFSDDARFVLGMSPLPAGGVVWKDAHMAGELDPGRTSAAAELLGQLQSTTAGDRDLALRFDDLMPLEQGRIDPYHRTAAAAHPDLAGRIEVEVQRLLATRGVLVHGDFSPKNLAAAPATTSISPTRSSTRPCGSGMPIVPPLALRRLRKRPL